MTNPNLKNIQKTHSSGSISNRRGNAYWSIRRYNETDKGDWIIKGIKGECYHCKPDVFDMTYEKVNMNVNIS